jgi:catechol-2,3-dioxygenase
MDLSLQSVLLNVSELSRSLEFYREVFGFRVLSLADEIAVLLVTDVHRRQIVVLRHAGRSPVHGGRGTIGPRLVSFEAGSPEELGMIEQRLSERQALRGRVRTDTYEGIVGVDPDRIGISIASSTTGCPIRIEDWMTISDAMYEFE